MLLEAIVLLTGLMLVLSVGLLLLKFVFFMVLLPFKLLFVLGKGLLGLLLLVPLLVVGALVVSALPLGLLLLVAPIVLVGGIVAKLVGC